MPARSARPIATYVYCLIGASRPPSVPAALKGLPGTGRIRLVPVPDAAGLRPSGRLHRWLVVSDAPLRAYSEERINASLGDLEWVGRAAVAHEAVVESFDRVPALLPMKLFTIFSTDERALEDVARQRARIDRLLTRVSGHQEWGVRVVLDPARAVSSARRQKQQAGTGIGYLRRKKSERDAAAGISRRARTVAAGMFRTLARHSTGAHRRPAAPTADRSTLLLDAAFLVRREDLREFKGAVASNARTLVPQGYAVSLTGPWPPYSFMTGN